MEHNDKLGELKQLLISDLDDIFARADPGDIKYRVRFGMETITSVGGWRSRKPTGRNSLLLTWEEK